MEYTKITNFINVLLVIISFYSCSIEDNEQSDSENYIRFQLDDTFYEGYSYSGIAGDLDFDDLNYYNIELNRIQGVTSSLPFQIYLEPGSTHSEFGALIYYTGSSYYSLTTKEDCDSGSNTVMDYQVNITRNDEEIGGIIKGSFNGEIGRLSGFPCDNCCYYISDFSGEFKLRIAQP